VFFEHLHAFNDLLLRIEIDLQQRKVNSFSKFLLDGSSEAIPEVMLVGSGVRIVLREQFLLERLELSSEDFIES
jgi:hypothetical protein